MRSRSINLLTLSFLLCSCASNPHTVGQAICTQEAPRPTELQQAPPPPQFFSRCLRQILQESKIDSDCSTLSQQWQMTSPPGSAKPNTGN